MVTGPALPHHPPRTITAKDALLAVPVTTENGVTTVELERLGGPVTIRAKRFRALGLDGVEPQDLRADIGEPPRAVIVKQALLARGQEPPYIVHKSAFLTAPAEPSEPRCGLICRILRALGLVQRRRPEGDPGKMYAKNSLLIGPVPEPEDPWTEEEVRAVLEKEGDDNLAFVDLAVILKADAFDPDWAIFWQEA